MSLTARCHSLRPDRTSGWLTYFELAEEGPRAGHFLVVGPGAGREPNQVQAALRAGQAAVRYLKEVPANAPPLTLLEATARILDHECAQTGSDLEFGCAVLEGRELWLLTRGAVRLVALSPEPGVPFGAERPHAVSVEAGERYFLGRVPETVEAATSEELRARLERGGGDGGLVLRLAASDRLKAVSPLDDEPVMETVEPRGTSKPDPAQAPIEPAPHFEALPPPSSMPPPLPAQVPAAKPRPKPSMPEPAPKPKTEPPISKPRSQQPVRPTPVVAPPAPDTAKDLPEVETPVEADVEPTPRTTESRGLGFWMGVVAAFFALAAL
ncbi:MAG TPA: hypothetical protein VFP10_12295, partial [Candidatus Eisenbacteria bacterium]|nr:hypothetical protein [Candidatus Eisenbacteria bacterium]